MIKLVLADQQWQEACDWYGCISGAYGMAEVWCAFDVHCLLSFVKAGYLVIIVRRSPWQTSSSLMSRIQCWMRSRRVSQIRTGTKQIWFRDSKVSSHLEKRVVVCICWTCRCVA